MSRTTYTSNTNNATCSTTIARATGTRTGATNNTSHGLQELFAAWPTNTVGVNPPDAEACNALAAR